MSAKIERQKTIQPSQRWRYDTHHCMFAFVRQCRPVNAPTVDGVNGTIQCIVKCSVGADSRRRRQLQSGSENQTSLQDAQLLSRKLSAVGSESGCLAVSITEVRRCYRDFRHFPSPQAVAFNCQGMTSYLCYSPLSPAVRFLLTSRPTVRPLGVKINRPTETNAWLAISAGSSAGFWLGGQCPLAS